MSFNTGNKLPSLDERDLYDNALNLDKAMNSTDPTWRDRFNVEKPTIDAALKSAGFMPAGFDFVTGGTLQPGDRNKAVYNPAPNGDNNWYRWNGVFPKEIAANSQPNPKDENNWVPVLIKTGVVEREALRRTYQEAGLNLVEGSFEQGGTLVNTNDVLLHETSGKVYTGPAGTVAAGTAPASGGFVDRSDKLKSAVMSIESVSGLCSTDMSALKFGDTVIVTRYHSKISAPLAQENYGGGVFIWSDIPRSEHDGGITIDPTKTFPSDWGGEVGTADWFTPTNSGRGCFVRVSNGNLADIDNFGGFPDGSISSDAALDGVVKGALRQAGFRGMISFGDGDYSFNRAHFFSSISLLNFKGKGDRSTILRYKGADRVFITIDGQYIFFSDFLTAASTSGKVFVKNYNQNGMADCDIYFTRVHGNSFRYMHECVGRGSVNYSCSISGGGVGTWTKVVSPDPFTPSPNPIIQSLETGMRRYASFDLQVDHARSIFEFATTGPAATHMNEVTIEGVQGNQLGILIEGGYLNTVNIKTGALVASLNGGVIKCNLLKNANIDLTASTYYGESTVPVLANTCNVMIQVTTESGTLTNGVLIDSLKLSGVFRGLSNRCIQTNGYVKDILISGLNLPDAYNYKASTNPIFVDVNGILAGSAVVIGDVTLGCSSWAGGAFNWINTNLTAKIGNYTKNAVPVKPYHRNNGAFSMDKGLLSKQVNHGMARTPSDVSISISMAGVPSGLGDLWISEVSETTFTVSTNAPPTANVRCVWQIDNSVV